MIFKTVAMKHTNGRTYHGVALYEDENSDIQLAVISSGETEVVALRLYNDLNHALVNAGLLCHSKGAAANDSGFIDSRISELTQRVNVLVAQNSASEYQAKNWKRALYAVAFMITMVTTILPLIFHTGIYAK